VNTEVEWSALVVYCRTEIKDGMVRYRVLETWKGEYRPGLFYGPPPAGYLYTGEWHGNANPVAGREVVFFFSADSHSWTMSGKFRDHMTAYVVTNGKVSVPATTGLRWSGQTEEWTLARFKREVLQTVRQQRAVAGAGVAGAWVATTVEPPAPDRAATGLATSTPQLVNQNSPSPEANTTPPGSPATAGVWWTLAAGLLGVGVLLGWRAHHRNSGSNQLHTVAERPEA
jgi:hypothetical protein